MCVSVCVCLCVYVQLVKSPASGNVAMECVITAQGLQQVAGVPCWNPAAANVLDANMVNLRYEHYEPVNE